MQNKIEHLRNHLFATLEGLRDKDNPMDIERAKAISNVANSIIETAKVEVKFIEAVGGKGTGFMTEPPLPAPERTSTPRLVGGKEVR
jgi:hypothetical protein